MQVNISASEIALRLALTFLACSIIGANRGERGRPAGLRTTVLVGLTAAASLILANLLLGTVGKASDAFATMDVMRFPLGVLTGMGFIGAGAILHKGNLVVGVTTAATLWFTTMMGFCFGAGQVGLGLSLLALGVFILWVLEWVETHWKQQQQATLTMQTEDKDGIFEDLLRTAREEGYALSISSIKYAAGEERSYKVEWKAAAHDIEPPTFLARFKTRPEVSRLEWTPLVKS